MTTAIRIDDLSVTLTDGDRRFRLEVGELTVTAGEAVALSGQSGTGKTCLLELIGLLRRPDPGGRYRLAEADGNVLALWNDSSGLAALRGRAFGFVPQSGGLLPFLTLAENIALSQKISGFLDPGWVTALADRLGLTGLMGLYPDALSLGQRQRGTIARALAHRPALVVADEPTASLDPNTADEAMGLIVEAARDGGSAVLISSHDLPLVEHHTARGYRLELAAASGDAVISTLREAS